MRCLNCNFENSNSAKFCQDCGTKLKAQCPACDYILSGNPKFCENCGHNLAKGTSNIVEPKQPTPPPRSYAERRQLTVLFCDMKGSTALSEILDAEQFREIILGYHNIAEAVIVKNQGHVAQYLGDGLMVYFGYPHGLEDAPQAAARSALGILQAMSPAADRWKKELNVDIAIRIGIHTGLVVVDDHLALGDTCNITARLEGLATENTAVVSQQTQKLIEGWFDLRPLGSRQIKGLSYPMDIFELEKEVSATSRLDLLKAKAQKPLIGRDEEVTLIENTWQKSTKRKGQVIVLTGDAGMGKSRLVDHWRTEVINQGGSQCIDLSCSRYHSNTPLYPLSDYIEKELLQIEIEDNEAVRLEKLKSFFVKSDRCDNDSRAILAELLSIPIDKNTSIKDLTPVQKKKKAFELILDLFLTQASTCNLLINIEDTHNVDSTTLEWIDLFVKQLSTFPICVLMTTREQLKSGWLKKSYVHQIEIGRIPEEKIQTICLQLTDGLALPKKLIDIIKEKTDGVPLFITELTRMVLNSGVVVVKAGKYKFEDSKKDILIPSTLQDLLMSRLDRLGPLKDLFQRCSIFGREFSFEMLHQVTGINDEELYRNLSDLVNEDVLIHHGIGALSKYVIKQALFRDLAYDSLLNSRKRKLHGSIADTYVTMYGANSGAHSEVLAYHLQEANRKELAAAQWYKTGMFALQKFASKEALTHFTNARNLLSNLPPTKENTELLINCQMQTVSATIISNGFVHRDVERFSLDCLKLREHHPTISHTSGLLHFLGWHYNFGGKYADALKYHKDNLELVKESQINHLISDVQINLGCTFYLMGKYRESEVILDAAVANINDDDQSIFEDYGFGKPIVSALYHILHVKFFKGSFEGTEELQKRAFRIRDETDNPWAGCLLSMWEVEYNYKVIQNYEASLAVCAKWVKVATEHKQPFWVGFFSFMLQLNKAMLGDASGIDVAIFIFNSFKEVGAMSYRLATGCDLVEACLLHKKYDIAHLILEEVKIHADNNDEGYCLPDFYRLTAQLNFEEGQEGRVESHFLQAIEIARSQDAKLHELRAAVDLSTYYIWHDRQSEVCKVLEPIHNRFDDTIMLPDYNKSVKLLTRCKSAANLLSITNGD